MMPKDRYVSLYRSPRARIELLSFYDKALRNWPIPFEERFVESWSGRTHVLVCGKAGAKPLLLFHGIGNNSLMWRYNVAQLGEHFQLYLIDTINDPGKSEASIEFNSDADYARWTTELLDELGITKALLLGHSKGGWIALNMMICAPGRVEKTVLLAPAVGINSAVRRQFMMRSLRVALLPTKKAVTSYLSYMSGSESHVSAAYAEYLSRLIRGTKHKLIRHRLFSDDELRSIDTPILLMFGDQEVSVEYRKVIERARACIKPLKVEIISGAGHALQGEKPDAVGRHIIGHFQG
jgi:pimeloyl-ACP methyl ester carboxylesterase